MRQITDTSQADTNSKTVDKPQHRKAYLKAKKLEHRRKNRTVSLSFPNALAAQMEKEAKTCGVKLAPYLKQCIEAYRNKSFVLPNEEDVRRLELLLQKYGNNLNQVVRLCHKSSIPPTEAIEIARSHLREIQNTLDVIFRTPRALDTDIQTAIVKNPLFVSKMLKTIADYIESKHYAD